MGQAASRTAPLCTAPAAPHACGAPNLWGAPRVWAAPPALIPPPHPPHSLRRQPPQFPTTLLPDFTLLARGDASCFAANGCRNFVPCPNEAACYSGVRVVTLIASLDRIQARARARPGWTEGFDHPGCLFVSAGPPEFGRQSLTTII